MTRCSCVCEWWRRVTSRCLAWLCLGVCAVHPIVMHKSAIRRSSPPSATLVAAYVGAETRLVRMSSSASEYTAAFNKAWVQQLRK